MSLLARMQNTFYSIWMNFMALPAIIMYKERRYRVGQNATKIPSLNLVFFRQCYSLSKCTKNWFQLIFQLSGSYKFELTLSHVHAVEFFHINTRDKWNFKHSTFEKWHSWKYGFECMNFNIPRTLPKFNSLSNNKVIVKICKNSP